MYQKNHTKLKFLIAMSFVSMLSTFLQTIWLKSDLENLEKRIFNKKNR